MWRYIQMLQKKSDLRLSKTLTLAEFIEASAVSLDVIYKVHPSPRAEQDSYIGNL